MALSRISYSGTQIKLLRNEQEKAMMHDDSKSLIFLSTTPANTKNSAAFSSIDL